MIGIRVHSLAGQLQVPATAAWFDARGGDIGRSTDCKLVLTDPERHVSRRHAQVSCRDGQFFLKLLSGGLPVDVDGRALQVGDEAALVAGARVHIGGYRLEVLDEPDSLGLPPAMPVASKAGPRSDFDLLIESLPPAPRDPPPPPQRDPLPPAQRDPVPLADATSLADPVGLAPIDLLVGETGAAERSGADPAAALLAGLRMPRPPAGAFGPEQWHLVGTLLRTMTEGLLELLTARMVAKREFGAQATQLRTRENNPMKFSPDVDAALAHLLGPAERGFLPPVEAAREAIDDLRAHQLALLAGMRAALDAVMARFDPAVLEQRISPGGAVESLIPSQRKARLWDAYSQQFAQIVGEVEGDFDALLGRAFLKAYQAQLAELARRDGDAGRRS